MMAVAYRIGFAFGMGDAAPGTHPVEIARLDFEFADIQVTASFGVAALAGSMPVEDAIGRADRAMYEAKAAGRNRVVLQR